MDGVWFGETSMTTIPSRVNLTIDRFVLRGFAPGDHATVVAAFEAELRHSLAETASSHSFGESRAQASLSGRVAADASPAGIGTRAARETVRGLRT